MSQTSRSRELDQFNVRLPDGMRDRLKERARLNMRSVNAEINVIIAKALEADRGTAA